MVVYTNLGLIFILEQMEDRVFLVGLVLIIRVALIVLGKGVILTVSGNLMISVVMSVECIQKVLSILIKSGFSSHLGYREIYPGARCKTFSMVDKNVDKTPEEEVANP